MAHSFDVRPPPARPAAPIAFTSLPSVNGKAPCEFRNEERDPSEAQLAGTKGPVGKGNNPA